MGTLLLRLAAPLQAWGIDSKFNIRQTGNVPSKSGVVGLLAAALGRTRDESVEDLSFRQPQSEPPSCPEQDRLCHKALLSVRRGIHCRL